MESRVPPASAVTLVNCCIFENKHASESIETAQAKQHGGTYRSLVEKLEDG